MSDPAPQPQPPPRRPDTTLQGLREFLQLLQECGVRRFSGVLDADPVEIELQPYQARAPVEDTAPAFPDKRELEKAEQAALCKCGHHVTEHGPEGGCLQGCPVEECAEGPISAP